jgi:hypothetical protein
VEFQRIKRLPPYVFSIIDGVASMDLKLTVK